MAYLILVRHGQSEWNEKGLWTGLTDVALNAIGKEEAKKTGLAIKNLPIDMAYSSNLSRARDTLSIILDTVGKNLPIKVESAVNERDYGIYTGKNKWEIQKEVGDEVFKKIRRSWDHPIPKGESLKMVSERVIPFYEKELLPKLKTGQNIIISAHGNSLRALVKYLESIADDKIGDLEIKTGEAWIYSIGKDGKVENKEVRAENAKLV